MKQIAFICAVCAISWRAGSCYAEKIEIRLDKELARPSGVVLRGPSPNQSVLFTLPRGRIVNSAHLTLKLRHSPSLLAGSIVMVAVNGTPVGTARLGTAGAELEANIDAAIPVEALTDFNRLEFHAALRNSPNQCENPADPGLWAMVSPATTMTFDLGGYRHQPGPDDFPSPLADPLDYRPATVRFVLTPEHTSSDYALAARIAGALGSSLPYRSARITAATSFEPDADASQVLFGSPQHLATITGVSAPSLDSGLGRLRVVENPRRPGRYLLWGEGAVIVARRKTWPSIPSAARRGELLPASDSFKLADIPQLASHDTTGSGITVRGADPEPIEISLKPGAGEHFVRGEQTVDIEYAYGPQVDTASSTMEVRLNGKTLRGRALDLPSGSASEALEVMLPTEALGEENVLELRFRLFPKNGGSWVPGGGGATGDQLWATLFGGTSFHLPRDSYADLPDFAALRNGGFPFRDAPAVRIAGPNTATLMLNAAFLLGRLAGVAPADVRFPSEVGEEAGRENHLIRLQPAPRIALEETISTQNLARVILTIRGSEENAGDLQDSALIARLGGASISVDAAHRVQIARAARTQRFGTIPLNRRVKYWVMDNMLWMIGNSVLFLFAAFFFLRYLRKNFFPPLPEADL